jgi:hypothetical protein
MANRRSWASITGFRFRCSISASTGCGTTGRRSSTTSRPTGRRTKTTFTWTSSGTGPRAAAPPGQAVPDGDDMLNDSPARSLSSTSTFRARWRRRPTQGSRGCASYAAGPAPAALLAVRRVGHPGGTVGCGRGLSAPLESSAEPDGWTDDQYDAFVVAGQLQRADRNGRLAEWLKPSLPAEDLARASTEGWILGVDPKPLDDRKRSVRRPSRPAAGPDAARTSLIRPVVVRRVVSAGGDRARLGDVSAAMGTACAPCGTKALGTGLITVTLERPPRARGRQERTGPDLLCLR